MKKLTFLIILIFLLIYILPLNVRPLIEPDETRYGEIPREMIKSCNWVVPKLDGLRYFEKPVLGYWFIASTMLAFGDNAFSARFPSALSVGLCAIFIFLFVRRFNKNQTAATLSALVFLVSFQIFGLGTYAVIDNVFSMFVTLSMILFYYAYNEDNKKKRYLYLIVYGFFCGLAFLAKGLIAFAIPVVSIVPFIIWEKNFIKILKITWVPIVSAIVILLPWSIMIYIAEPDFWNHFIFNEHFKRFMSENAQHGEPFLYFVPVFIGGFLPWTMQIPAAIVGLKKIKFNDSLVRYCICWFIFTFIFFSSSDGKLLTYILPLFPAISILVGIGLIKYFESGKTLAFNIGALVLGIILISVVIVLSVNQLSNFLGFVAYKDNAKFIVAVSGLLIWALLCLLSMKKFQHKKKLALFCLAPVCFYFMSQYLLPDQPRDKQAPGEFLLENARYIKPTTKIVSSEDIVRAVCWYYKRNNVYLLMQSGELDYGIAYDDSRHRLLKADTFKKLINANKGNVVLAASLKEFNKYKAQIPKPKCFDTNGFFVFACY